MYRFCIAILAGLFFVPPALAQDAKNIQDNSFLLEESYNQEAGVVQEINFFTWSPTTHNWLYTFTNEWPVTGLKHQFSYTIVGAHNGGFSHSGGGIGDVALNYRYQLSGSGETRFACSPRLSVLLPTGDSQHGRGFGGTGLQTNIPVSVTLHPKLVTHINAGATWVPHGKDEFGNKAGLTGYNLGQSFIWLASTQFNVMFEALYNDIESVVAPGKTIRNKDLLLSPGVRWSHNFENGLQIVPGVAVPIGAGPSAGQHGLIFYLSFEQPLKILNWQKRDKSKN